MNVYLLQLWRYRIQIALVGVLSGVLGFVYTQVTEPVYEAEVRVLIEKRGLNLDGDSNAKEDREFLNTQAEVIRSPLILTQSLEEVSAYADGSSEELGKLVKNLRVTPLAKTDIVRVTYQHQDAAHAVERLRSVVESYRRHVRESEHSVSTETLTLLTQREQQLNSQVKALQAKLKRLRLNAPWVGDSNEALYGERQGLRRLEEQLALVVTQLTGLDGLVDSNDNSSTELVAHAAAADNPTLERELAGLRTELAQAQGQLADAREHYRDGHPMLRAARQRAEATQEQLDALQASAAEQLIAKLKIAQAQRAELEARIDSERERLQSYNNQLLEEQALVEELARLEQLRSINVATLESLQLSEQAIAEGRASVFVQVIDDYAVADEPLWPMTLPITGASVMVGLLLACSAVVIRNYRLFLTPQSAASIPPASTVPASADTEHKLQSTATTANWAGQEHPAKASTALDSEKQLLDEVRELRELLGNQVSLQAAPETERKGATSG